MRGGFGIPYLSDHDDVRILAQERAQAGGEGQADLAVGLHLVDAGEVVLHGIFRGGDVHPGPVEFRKHAVEGGGLAASGGTP